MITIYEHKSFVRELSSGTGTVNAIQSVSITQSVNDSTELTLGSVCAGMLEATLITPAGGLSLTAGDTLTVYREDGMNRHKVGLFLLEKTKLRLRRFDCGFVFDRNLYDYGQNTSTRMIFRRKSCENRPQPEPSCRKEPSEAVLLTVKVRVVLRYRYPVSSPVP